MVRLWGLNIAFLFISFIGITQELFVSLEVRPHTLEKGEPIILTVKTNIDGDINIDFPKDFVQSGGVQSGMSSSIEISNGKRSVVSYRFKTFTGYLTKSGDYKIGPATINYNKKEYQSETHNIRVLDSKEMISSSPEKNMDKLIFGLIELSKKEIYEGEPVVVLGKVYAQIPVLQFEDYIPFLFDKSTEEHHSANWERVKTSYEVINGKNVQTFEIGKRVVFPETVGKHSIEAFETVVLFDDPRSFYPKRNKIVSNKVSINVKPLPEGMPSHFINAVGKYKMKGKIDNTHIQQGDVVELRIEISGNGNIQNIVKPNIDLPEGLAFYGDPEIEDSITFCSLGGVGKRIFTYYVQVNKGGEVKIPTIKASYFDIKTEKYETLSLKLNTIYALPNESNIALYPIAPTHSTSEMIDLGLQTYLINDDLDPSPHKFVDWGRGTLLFSPLLLGVFAGLIVRKKKQISHKKSQMKDNNDKKQSLLKEIEILSSNHLSEDKISQLSALFYAYLSTCLEIDVSMVTRQETEGQKHRFSEEQFSIISKIWNKIDHLRYGGGISQDELDEFQTQIKSFVNAMKK